MTIPEGVTSIGRDAFNYCLSLTTVTIPKSMRSIGDHAFDCCYALKKMFFADDNLGMNYITWGNEILRNISPLPTVYCHSGAAPSYWAVTEGCPTVLFEDMAYLQLPANLTEIKAEAFAGTNCEAVVIPDGCLKIGSRAFAGCSRLTYVRIPKSVVSIAKDAFEGCGDMLRERAE